MANVHKDFHGALSYGLQFLDEHFGQEGVRAFLSGLAESVYKPLVEDVRSRGVVALRDHWQHVFALEGGEIELREEGHSLELRVLRCPAIAHMKQHNYPVAARFCEHTRVVNEAVCRAAGFECEVEYDQPAGRCVQRFWRAAE
ncbi:MAG TPA: hypothetical protein VMZ06_03370 [Candidatus Bathyarchaeia archaeon]|nr:hypothetical protein [Candidatus Bathyarchaeia archaeon]